MESCSEIDTNVIVCIANSVQQQHKLTGLLIWLLYKIEPYRADCTELHCRRPLGRSDSQCCVFLFLFLPKLIWLRSFAEVCRFEEWIYFLTWHVPIGKIYISMPSNPDVQHGGTEIHLCFWVAGQSGARTLSWEAYPERWVHLGPPHESQRRGKIKCVELF